MRDEFQSEIRRLFIVLPMSGPVGVRRIPPMRQKEVAWMGHPGSWAFGRGFISGRNSPRRVMLLLMSGFALWMGGLGAAVVVCAQNADVAANFGPQTAAQPQMITLEEAIHRAEGNEPTYAAALAQSKVSSLDRLIARNGLLPGVVYHNQYLYTQGTGLHAQSTGSAIPQVFLSLIHI